MKNLVNAIKKEEYFTPIMLLIGMVVYTLESFSNTITNTIMGWIDVGIEKMPFLIDIPDVIFGFTIAILFAIPMYLLYLVIKRDWALQKLPRDEREMQHDYDTSHLAYQILSGLLFYYWFFADPSNLWLMGILLVTFIFRLWRRLELEYRG